LFVFAQRHRCRMTQSRPTCQSGATCSWARPADRYVHDSARGEALVP
jgi:hypothetical protein